MDALTQSLADIRLTAKYLRAYGYGQQVEQAAGRVYAADPPEEGKPRGVSPLVAEYNHEFATNGKSKRLAIMRELMAAITNAIEVSRGNREGDDPKALASIMETLCDSIAPVAEPAKPNATGDESGATSRKPTTNDRMKAELASNLEVVKGWTAQQWADRLDCGKATIVETETWKSLTLLRQQMKAEKRADRNVKRPNKTRK